TSAWQKVRSCASPKHSLARWSSRPWLLRHFHLHRPLGVIADWSRACSALLRQSLSGLRPLQLPHWRSSPVSLREAITMGPGDMAITALRAGTTGIIPRRRPDIMAPPAIIVRHGAITRRHPVIMGRLATRWRGSAALGLAWAGGAAFCDMARG